MLYFIPDWEDRLDPDFDFEHDCYSPNRKEPYKHDVYAHQILEKSPYDGILISLSLFQGKIRLKDNNGHYTIRGINSIKEYLKIGDKQLTIMADCGAFNYVNEEKPPISTDYAFKVYQDLGFDLGVSVDHLIFDSILIMVDGQKKKHILSEQEKEARRSLTLKNAEDFINLCQKENPQFIPIGVAQGYSEDTYYDSVDKLIEMGYEYIALGGLVRSKTEEIISILDRIYPLFKSLSKRIKLHLFGVLRQEKLKKFAELGVFSFDSASFLRKAWLRSTNNYLGVDGNWYSAIRVPQSWDPRMKKKAGEDKVTKAKLEKMEQECLKVLNAYNSNELKDVSMLLDIIVEYDNLLIRSSSDGNGLKSKYRNTLESRIWEKCGCEICKDIGINVVIFRGANRNKRRGFHNTKIFYDTFMPNQIHQI